MNKSNKKFIHINNEKSKKDKINKISQKLKRRSGGFTSVKRQLIKYKQRFNYITEIFKHQNLNTFIILFQ